MKEAKKCRNFINEHSTPENQQFMDILAAEIPTEDLDG